MKEKFKQRELLFYAISIRVAPFELKRENHRYCAKKIASSFPYFFLPNFKTANFYESKIVKGHQRSYRSPSNFEKS